MVKIGDVQTFREVRADKAQALKPLEEAAEVFGAWQTLDEFRSHLPEGAEGQRKYLLDECADVIQATCNLIAALNVEDFTPFMDACRKRNEERGRM